MLVESLKDVSFDLNAYEKYLEVWLRGIRSEIGFWRRTMEMKIPDKRGWTLSDRPCDIEIERFLEPLEKTMCIDIGSGPFVISGDKTDKTKLHFTAVDPLAYCYKALRKKYKYTAGIAPEYCMVERLTEKFGKETFDIVHMKNALDHAFNPVLGIMQMMSICKKGGKIILRHTKREAEKENYRGFHQWNLDSENDDFIIYRRDDKYNVSKMFCEYANIIVEAHTPEYYLTVVLTKERDVEIDAVLQNTLQKILDEKIFERLLEYAFLEAYSIKENVISIINRIPVLGPIAQKIYRICGG